MTEPRAGDLLQVSRWSAQVGVKEMTKPVTPEERITAMRAKLAERFISGCGLEVGAGARPFPVPAHAQVVYGDIRERAALESYFKTRAVSSDQRIDAQSLAGVADNSLDFVISAHVIEHLLDPVRAIVNAIRVLKRGGIHILVVPDMRRTFDRHRPETTLAHALADFALADAEPARPATRNTYATSIQS
jgi:SAM-dependent methyltransferase